MSTKLPPMKFPLDCWWPGERKRVEVTHTRCPVTGKRCYASKADAYAAIDTLRAAGRRERGAYLCEHCHSWHMTRQKGMHRYQKTAPPSMPEPLADVRVVRTAARIWTAFWLEVRWLRRASEQPGELKRTGRWRRRWPRVVTINVIKSVWRLWRKPSRATIAAICSQNPQNDPAYLAGRETKRKAQTLDSAVWQHITRLEADRHDLLTMAKTIVRLRDMNVHPRPSSEK